MFIRPVFAFMNIILGVSGAVIQQRAPTDLLNYDCINDPKGDMTGEMPRLAVLQGRLADTL